MRSVNKAILLGNLGKDPELKYMPDGRPVARFSVATSESWTSKEGERKEKTEWHRIVAWGKVGEICGEYLRKGRQVYIEGRIETRTWEDRDKQQRTTTEINAQNVVLLGSPRGAPTADDGGGGGGGARPRPAPAQPAGGAAGGPAAGGGGYDDMPADATDGGDFRDDDVPF